MAALNMRKAVKLAIGRAPLYLEFGFGDSTCVVFL
jgi:hypothetical protein